MGRGGKREISATTDGDTDSTADSAPVLLPVLRTISPSSPPLPWLPYLTLIPDRLTATLAEVRTTPLARAHLERGDEIRVRT